MKYDYIVMFIKGKWRPEFDKFGYGGLTYDEALKLANNKNKEII